MTVDTQPINQLDADEIVRILITVHPDFSIPKIALLARDEGMPLNQAARTAEKYIGSWPTRCVEHNAVMCGRCRL